MKQFNKKNVFKLAGAVALAWCATGTASADILIGSTVSATGPASFLGEPEARTLKMLVDDINAKGGVQGEKIKLVAYDDGGDPNKARTFATRLIEDDEVVAVIGGTTTGTTMSIIPVVEEAGVPFISLAGAIEIIQPVRKHTFKTPHTDRMACAKIFEDMKARKLTKIGLLSGSDSFGASMRKQCLDIVGDYGITIVGDETFGPADADMTPQLTNLRNKDGIQAILNLGMGSGPAIVTRNYAQLAVDMPLYQSHGVASDAFIELAGAKAAEGVRLPGTSLLVAGQLAEDDPQRAVVQAYKQRYEGDTGKPVSTFGGYAHDALYLIVDAINRAGKAEPAAIRDALESTAGYMGTTGSFTMTPQDHLGLDLSAFRMLEIRDGGWKIVE
ncbi:ABC transporter substrate-binding protein [Kerstersia gyiorum]|jgi:branched-chain amino acid transport system substrate-binding protein|uniref:ABC transporter substrate-binding protein n=1 Tax=Kerstersia gyiorum TaxID=206506 RepID=UPI002432416B|nr:ABC transporter substrate-binding protein [Kerstersia gyiorum]MCH4271031.1 ABC transporter substrate-binding protein [Kerstersia gyiorum]MCI1227826.1 ABC transporter substrate-binding protein [Kerstersia gyiorum]